jgi:hypothetical protein
VSYISTFEINYYDGILEICIHAADLPKYHGQMRTNYIRNAHTFQKFLYQYNEIQVLPSQQSGPQKFTACTFQLLSITCTTETVNSIKQEQTVILFHFKNVILCGTVCFQHDYTIFLDSYHWEGGLMTPTEQMKLTKKIP